MANDERNLAQVAYIASAVFRHNLIEEVQSAYAGFQAADTYREKVAATQPLQLSLADIADELNGRSLPRNFDGSRDYVGEAERRFGDGKILDWLIKLAGIATSFQGLLDDLAGK